MSRSLKSFSPHQCVAAAATALIACCVTTSAFAGCGDAMLRHKAAWLTSPSAADPAFRLASYDAVPSIVGLWGITFTTGTTLYDFGYAVWHSDGTEFFNSGGRAPATQNYCLGVYEKTACYSYKLNHFALSYDPAGKLAANVNIRENVKLDRSGNSFSGTFTINAYDPTSGAKLGQQVAGTVMATRITAD